MRDKQQHEAAARLVVWGRLLHLCGSTCKTFDNRGKIW